MAIVFVDYSPLYYSSVTKTALPSWIKGKFVQIRNESTLYLVFSPSEFTKYHADIVRRFCLDRGIEGSYNAEKKRYDVYDKAWKIQGGGKFESDTAKKTLRLYDDSMAYGKFGKTGLREIFSTLPEFSGFTVLVE